MATITEAARGAFRAFDTDGVPASGEHDPIKSEIIGAFAKVQSEIELARAALALTGVIYYATRANAYAANPAVGTGGIVYADPTPANNGIYVHATAGTGAGNWPKADFTLASSVLTDIATQQAALDGLAGTVATVDAKATSAQANYSDLAGQAVHRPGNAPSLFSNEPTGLSASLPPLAFGMADASATLGSFWKVRPEDISDPSGSRDYWAAVDFEIRTGRTYLAFARAARLTDADPATPKPLRLLWQNLNGNGNSVSQVILKTVANPQISDGEIEIAAFIGKAGAPVPDGMEALDYVIPPSTVYARDGLRVSSNGQSTAITAIGVIDVTDNVAGGVDVSAILALTITGTGLAVGGGSLSSGPVIEVRQATADEMLSGSTATPAAASPQNVKQLNDAMGARFYGGAKKILTGARGHGRGGFYPGLGTVRPDGSVIEDAKPGSGVAWARQGARGHRRQVIFTDGRSFGFGVAEPSSSGGVADAPIVSQIRTDAADTWFGVKFQVDGIDIRSPVAVQVSDDQNFLNERLVSGSLSPMKLAGPGTSYLDYTYYSPEGKLTPQGTYWGRVLVDGVPYGSAFRLPMAPTPGVAAPDVDAILSCEDPSPMGSAPIRVRSAMAADPTIRFVHGIGDEPYYDATKDDQAEARSVFRTFGANPAVVASRLMHPEQHDDDDHEVMNDYHNATTVPGSTIQSLRSHVREVMRELEPSVIPWAQIVDQGSGVAPADLCRLRVRNRGKRRIITFDLHAFKTRPDVGAGIAGTLFGAYQLDLICNKLIPQAAADAAAGKINLLELVCTSGLGAQYDGVFSQAVFIAEWKLICDALIANRVNLPLTVVWTGDYHRGAADSRGVVDKTTAQLLTVPMFMASPGLRAVLTGSGPFTYQGAVTHIDVGEQFCRRTYAGDGAFTVEWLGFTGVGGSLATLKTINSTDGIKQIEFAAATVNGAVGSTVQVPIRKKWKAVSPTELAFGKCSAHYAGGGYDADIVLPHVAGQETVPVVVQASPFTLTLTAPSAGSELGAQSMCVISS